MKSPVHSLLETLISLPLHLPSATIKIFSSLLLLVEMEATRVARSIKLRAREGLTIPSILSLCDFFRSAKRFFKTSDIGEISGAIKSTTVSSRRFTSSLSPTGISFRGCRIKLHNFYEETFRIGEIWKPDQFYCDVNGTQTF